MDEAQVVRIMILITHQNPPVVSQPRKQLLCSAAVSVLCIRLLAIAFVRRYHLDVERLKSFVQRIRVIGIVANQACGFLICEALSERFVNKGDIMRRSRLSVRW